MSEGIDGASRTLRVRWILRRFAVVCLLPSILCFWFSVLRRLSSVVWLRGFGDGFPFAGDPFFGEVQAGVSAVEFVGGTVVGAGGFDVGLEGAEVDLLALVGDPGDALAGLAVAAGPRVCPELFEPGMKMMGIDKPFWLRRLRASEMGDGRNRRNLDSRLRGNDKRRIRVSQLLRAPGALCGEEKGT
ncbi:MAG: hypothetical protein A2Y76_10650 [Planctomycetes bacterium RBG_13_60_9]|nr:MAG: hypothetical protein A2Y76_10650 [Planctomycetes bacterium RBG_13_60_9]